MSATTIGTTPRLARARGLGHSWRSDKVLVAAAATSVLVLLVAVLAPVLAPHDPNQTDILAQSQSPSAGHPFGTDALGRDIFSRVLYGARLSLLGPACVVLLAIGVGVTMAIASVWIGGRFDRVTARVMDVLFAIPGLLLAILAVAIVGEGLVGPVIAISIAYTPYITRVIRSVALTQRSLPYIDACQLLGYSGWRICTGHLLRNVRGMVAAQATLVFASALVDLAAVSFLGLGAQPPDAEWGVMVGDGSSELLNGYPQQSLAAGGAIVLTVVAFNVLGERLTARSAVNRK